MYSFLAIISNTTTWQLHIKHFFSLVHCMYFARNMNIQDDSPELSNCLTQSLILLKHIFEETKVTTMFTFLPNLRE